MNVFTPALSRNVELRPDTNDQQVWADTFTGLYHVPPDTMPAPRTVLDLGANIGLTAAHYAHLWPDADILAVEMDKANVEMIRRNAPLVRLAPFAVTDRVGYTFYDGAAPSDAYAVGPGLVSYASSPTARTVHTRTLRQLILSGFGEEGVDFVKMDIEGSEWRVLEHRDWVPLVRHLLVELHPNGSWGDDGRGDPAGLVEITLGALEELGFDARPHPPHPQAVFATR